MLKSVEIKGFRSCEHVEFDTEQSLIALLGRNGVGKSNILRAIYLAAKYASAPRPADRPAFGLDPEVTVALGFDSGGGRFRYRITGTPARRRPGRTDGIDERLDVFENGVWRNLASRDTKQVTLNDADQIVHILADPATPLLFVLSGYRSADGPYFKSALDFLSGVHYYPLNEKNSFSDQFEGNIFQGAEIVEWRRSTDTDRLAEKDAELRIISMHLFETERFEEFVSLVGPDGLSLFDEVRVHRSGTSEQETEDVDGVKLDLFYYIQYRKNGRLLFYPALSYGTRRIVNIVAAMVSDQSTLMLIEHPEDGIHIGLLRRLFGIMRSYRRALQIFVATHSRTLLNEMQIDELRFVSNEAGVTQIGKLSGASREMAERYISATGDDESGSLADFVELCDEDLFP